MNWATIHRRPYRDSRIKNLDYLAHIILVIIHSGTRRIRILAICTIGLGEWYTVAAIYRRASNNCRTASRSNSYAWAERKSGDTHGRHKNNKLSQVFLLSGM